MGYFFAGVVSGWFSFPFVAVGSVYLWDRYMGWRDGRK